ncbi:MAG: Flp pilus assembly complex ATPase component TadA [Deltaproteobacteria bacterium]|nr:Flp pilus assembly complex ATPase component TadA [Deltaproteobacteria bacterium]
MDIETRQPLVPSPENGMITKLLLAENIISPQELAYAVRVRSKLTTPKTMIDSLLDLGYLTREVLQETLRNNRVNIRLGDFLVELGYLREADLKQALGIQGEPTNKQRLGEILISRGFIEEKKLLEALSYQLGYPLIELSFVAIDRTLFSVIPLAICQEFYIIPVRREESFVVLALSDPLDKKAHDCAKRFIGDKARFVIASKDSINNTLKALERTTNQPVLSDENTIIGMINTLLDDALQEGASDIHIEPMKDRLRVRFRLDGVMNHYKDFPKEIAPQLSTRIKVMAQADIAEKRRHQDGRMLFKSHKHGIDLDLRVSIFITIYGEKIVMRLLNSKTSLLDIKEIGMAPRMLEHFIYEAVEVPSGVMIITGPTGSGKTSTLYSCVNYLNDVNTSIITAEDPVEIVIDGISQCSINAKIGVTFEETLRHIVRQDPDIIVLGEIRDHFSAETAIQAALTGHKVLTTFHTEDSIGGLIRLMNMEIEAFLISSTVVCVVAQRLLRRVCPECAEPYIPTALDLSRLNVSANDLVGAEFKLGRGCKACRFSGYHGRVGVFELLVMNEMVKNAILNKKSSYEIRKISIETSGMVTLIEDGLVKGARGEISMKEIITDLPRLGKPRPLAELRRILGVTQ